MNGNSAEAEFHYSKYVNTSSKKEDQLNYAHTLLSNGKCKDAVKWYQNYINAGGEIENVHFIKCVRRKKYFIDCNEFIKCTFCQKFGNLGGGGQI